MTSENGNAKSDQPDDRKFLIPREHIKRKNRMRKQVITGKGASTGNVMGAPEHVTRASSPFVCEEDLKRH